MRHVAAAVAIVAVAALSVALAASPWSTPPYTGTSQSDLNHDGIVTSADLGVVATDFGNQVATPYPCSPYVVFDGTVTAEATIVNSLGEAITPTGGMFLVPGDDPRWQMLRDGTPAALYPC